MKVILLQDIENLGDRHETVTVKPGYGRNYLIPQGKAIVANPSNSNHIGELLRQSERLAERELEGFRAIIAKLDNADIKIGAKTGTTEKIFGSVTNVQLAEAIRNLTGMDVDRRKITIEDEIKTLGEYTAHIDFHKNLKYDLNFEVVPA